MLDFVVNLPVGVVFQNKSGKKEFTMNFVGVDLHKKTITIGIVNEGRETLFRTTLSCDQEQAIVELFRQVFRRPCSGLR